MAAPRRHDMSVHMERNEELPLKLRLSFTNMPCSLINVDMVDEGESYAHGELWSELHKVPLDASGAKIPGSRERVDLTRDREFKEGLALHTAQHRRGLLGEKEGPREGGTQGAGQRVERGLERKSSIRGMPIQQMLTATSLTERTGRKKSSRRRLPPEPGRKTTPRARRRK